MALVDKGMGSQQSTQLGLPEGFQAFTPGPMTGMDQQSDRIGLDDKEFFLLENYIKVGDSALRTLWDRGTTLYSAPGSLTVVKFFWYSLGTTQYCAVFLSDGSAVQVAYPSGTVTTIGPAGTFYSGGNTPACCQWGVKYLLISNNINANAYWIWDGSILYTSGTIGPIVTVNGGGNGYSSTPTVNAFGGTGTGITATATVVNSTVTSINITNPGTGYVPGDVVQFQVTGGGTDNTPKLVAVLTTGSVQYVTMLNGGTGYTSPPTVGFSGGGGSNAAGTSVLTGTGVASATLVSGGSGYTSAPGVSISGGGGTGATATATIFGGAVSTVLISNAGSGFTALPTISFSGGGGAGANFTAVLAPTSVASVAITSGGSGYTGSPSVAFTGGGGGSGASASASLSKGSVTAVTVVSGGTNFTGTPSISFSGGGGSGATGTAVLTGGAITSVSITSGGSGYTSAPAVVVAPGLNNAAYATATLMPFVVNGYNIETYKSRVWLSNTYNTGASSNGGVILTSVAGSVTDFSTADGGNTFTSNEPFLRQQYNGMKQAQDYLYSFGDSATDLISNVQTSGSPSTTTFNYQNVDAQIGVAWRDTAQYCGLSILFGNQEGVFGLYGGAVKNVSKKVLKLFNNAVWPSAGGITPSAAVANIYTNRVYLINMTFEDPVTNANRTAMLMWDEQNWYIASQSSTLTFIGSQASNSTYTAWGTDGTNLFPLFAHPSSSLVKRFSTKLYGGNSFPVVKQGYGFWALTTDVSSTQVGVTWTCTYDTEGGSTAFQVSPLSFSGYPMIATEPGNYFGTFAGVSCTTYSPDFYLRHMVIGWVPYFGGYGDPPIASVG